SSIDDLPRDDAPGDPTLVTPKEERVAAFVGDRESRSQAFSDAVATDDARAETAVYGDQLTTRLVRGPVAKAHVDGEALRDRSWIDRRSTTNADGQGVGDGLNELPRVQPRSTVRVAVAHVALKGVHCMPHRRRQRRALRLRRRRRRTHSLSRTALSRRECRRPSDRPGRAARGDAPW